MTRPGARPASRPAPGAPNQSLARGLAILEAFSRERAELGIRELSRLLGVDKSIVHRLARTLVARGFLEQSGETQRYRIGARAFSVGQQYAVARGLEETALPVLRDLTREHELNAYLGVLTQGAVVYRLALQSAGPIVIRVSPGALASLHSTALGKALLAAEPDEVARRLLGRGPLPRLTAATLTDPEVVLEHVREARRLGYAVSDEENLPGVLAIGAPVRDRTGQVVAAISGARPRYLTPDSAVPGIARVVVEAARAISRRLGHDL
jgi:DNA-binding IclR family transcriptional regulator